MSSDIQRYIEDNNPDKRKFLDEFAEIRPDLFFPEAWDDVQKAQAAEVVRPQRVKTGMLSAIPMTCAAAKCPYAAICPLLEKNLAPTGKPCPLELNMVKVFFEAYIEELDVDPTKMVEVSMVRDLVDQEIQQNRATWLLSLEHFIQDNVVGVDSDGSPVMRKELHMAVEFQDKIHRRKEKLRSALLATREARAKVGQGQLDNAQVVSNLLSQIKEADRLKDKAIRKRLNIPDDVDDYIEADVVEEPKELEA